jgi:hypothetical protein
MAKNVNELSSGAVFEIGEKNGASMDKISKRIVIKPETLHKMKKLVSLFDDEISSDVKEPELIGYFLEKGFNALVESGEIDRRVKAVLGK